MHLPDLIPEDFENQPDYFRVRIDSLIQLSVLKLSLLIDYIDQVELAINSGLELIQKEIKKTKSEGYSEHLIDEWIIRAQHWPEFLYKSIVITVQIVIEKILNDFCEEIRQQKNLEISCKELRGSGFKRAILYLEKIGNIKVPKENGNWIKLKMLNNIRNVIVHSDGIVPEKDHATPTEIMNFDHIEIDNSREIQLSLEYSRDIIGTAGRFIHDLGGEIKEM